jgi:hypothetical protein
MLHRVTHATCLQTTGQIHEPFAEMFVAKKMLDLEQKVTRLGDYNFVSCDSANVTVFAVAAEISLLNQAFLAPERKSDTCYSLLQLRIEGSPSRRDMRNTIFRHLPVQSHP